jgi:hypothetical protein
MIKKMENMKNSLYLKRKQRDMQRTMKMIKFLHLKVDVQKKIQK